VPMQFVSGLFFAAALALAVTFGGQTLDYTWGPALVALTAALLTACSGAVGLRQRGMGTWIAGAFLGLAWGWVLWRCWGSPVKEFARSDALLVGGAMAAFCWGLLVAPGGAAVRLLMVALALLGIANLGIGLYQMREPDFSWLFARRPAQFPSGLFGHYNHLADFSLVSAALLAARFFFARDRAVERGLQGLGVLACVGCVFISGSRGGMLSMCAAAGSLLALSALVAWRDKSKKRLPLGIATLAMPLVLIAVAVPVLRHFQERRGIEDGNLEKFADNRSRLHSYGTAVDLSAKHPLTGGGSRSFGWEKYAAWKPAESGLQPPNDDFVHNEFLQAAVDYGWTGAGLIGVALLVAVLCGVAGLISADSSAREARRPIDAMMCGGLAAMAGTLVHSNFSFVTHTIPGAMYLGLALGFALPRRAEDRVDHAARPLVWAGFAGVFLVPFCAVLGFAGWRGALVLKDLWPVLFGSQRLAKTAPGLGLERMEKANVSWPGSELSGRAGHIAREAALREGLPVAEMRDWLSQAADLYGEAARLNPYDPEWPVNRANVLSALGRDDEAERDYETAVRLEGGMEGTFRARFYFAKHLYLRWYRAWTKQERPAGEAMAGFLKARELFREASTLTEAWVRGKEEAELVKGLEETITFLEGAKVLPEPAGK
jgi:hypothetical protein